MIRHLLMGTVYLGLLTLPASSAPIQLIEGLPDSFTPGQPVAFNVHLPAIANLGSYNIDLVVEGNGIAGVDFFFDVAATMAATANYVFPTSANYFDAANADSAVRHRITLTDFDFAGVAVAAGDNDQVANVVIQTSPAFSGQLSLFVDANSLILDTPDVASTPVEGFEMLRADINASGAQTIRLVPEPSSGLLILVAISGSLVYRVPRHRRQVQEIQPADQMSLHERG